MRSIVNESIPGIPNGVLYVTKIVSGHKKKKKLQLTSANDPFNGDERHVNLLGKFMYCLVRVFIGEGVNVGTHSGELNCRRTLRRTPK